jgi:hypothetical protein
MSLFALSWAVGMTNLANGSGAKCVTERENIRVDIAGAQLVGISASLS